MNTRFIDWLGEDILDKKVNSLISETMANLQVREFTNKEAQEFCAALTNLVEKTVKDNTNKTKFNYQIED